MHSRIAVLLSLLFLLACPDKEVEPPTPPPAPEPSGPVIIEVRGDVTMDGAPLKPGDTIDATREIVVGEGRATIELPDGATLRLYANTRMRMPQKNKVRLFFGKVWALIAPRFEDSFEVETTNAVAGVRGTQLIVEASETRTRVAVVTGVVEVSNLEKREAKKKVTKGQEVVVEAKKPPTEPAAFAPEAEEKAWEKLGELEAVPAPEETELAPEEVAPPKKRRPKNQLEREGEETKRRLIEEGKRTEKQLKQESAETKSKLKQEEDAVRRKMKENEKRAKEGGSVKDFLE